MRILYSHISHDSRVRYNKIKDEYKKHFPDSKLKTIYESEGFTKQVLDSMSAGLLIKIAEFENE